MRLSERILRFLTVSVVAMALLAGCGGGYIDNAASPAALITPRQTWELSGDLANMHRAIDANLMTAAFAPRASDIATLTIDLGKPCLLGWPS